MSFSRVICSWLRRLGNLPTLLIARRSPGYEPKRKVRASKNGQTKAAVSFVQGVLANGRTF
jgi:hypothetical protein